MHRKRSLIRVLTRVLYAGGFIFLIVGLLLSALSSSVMAAGIPNIAQAQVTATFTPCCVTVTPFGTPRKPTSTGVGGTPRPTHKPVAFNLSSICGYPSDTYELWRVANHTNSGADYSWKVEGSSEKGSGHVAANGVDYFKTSLGTKIVHLLVDNQVVDTEACLAPCKSDLQLSYTCTPNGLEWHASNVNRFGVDYDVMVDHKFASKGKISANSSALIATTTTGAHTVELTWTDTRPESHTVTLSSPANSCASTVITSTATSTVTATPTTTLTPVTNIITETATPTQTASPTVTGTFTPHPSTITLTSTPTTTFTPVTNIITETVTPTQTASPTVTGTFTPHPSTITLTATATLTPATNTITETATPTQTASPTVTPTKTASPTVTKTVLSAPPVIITETATATNTATASPTVTTTLTSQPGFLITPTTAVNTLTPTVTSTATHIATLAPPAVTTTSTPVLIPVTGVDLTRPIGANSLSLFGGLFTNIGLFTLGLALALTGINSQLKD